MKALDLKGKVFGQLTAIEQAGSDKNKNLLWRCSCACGNDQYVQQATVLARGGAKSCGCQQRNGDGKVTHGATRGAEHGAPRKQGYRVWCNMKNRCDSPTNPQYKDYGGRGITYCEAWAKFENFLADMGEADKGMTLDRIDNDKGYSKENCRWTDRVTQRRNSRSHVRWLEIEGERMILTDAVSKYKVVSMSTATSRIHKGWDPVRAVLTPYQRSDNKGYRLS
jgi:hypothetical protein